jgi:hypothetical protein
MRKDTEAREVTCEGILEVTTPSRSLMSNLGGMALYLAYLACLRRVSGARVDHSSTATLLLTQFLTEYPTGRGK